jgi:hypothetical protein
MTDPPRIYDPPVPPRRFVTAILIAVALVLLLMHLIFAGTAFVAAALVSSLYDVFRSRPSSGQTQRQRQPGPTAGTS